MKNFFKYFGIIVFSSILCAAPRPTAEDLQICYEKNKISQFDYHGHTAVALTGNLAAVLVDENKTLSPVDYIKHDPYLGLYLVKIPTTLIAPFMMDEKDIKPDTWVNVLEDNATQIGHIKSFAQNLGDFDELSFEADKNGLLLCDCCQMVGIAKGGDKFIGSRYLRHFIKYDDVFYGDIGAVFNEINGTISVKSVYPFGPAGNKLMPADIVKSVNEIVPKDIRELNEMVLFANKGETLRFEIQRGEKRQFFDIIVPNSNDSYFDSNITKFETKNLEIAKQEVAPIKQATKAPIKKEVIDTLYKNFGISLNKNMQITRIAMDSPAHKAGFEVGDLVVQVEKVRVKTAKEFENRLNPYKVNHVLVERDNFEFFIRLQK